MTALTIHLSKSKLLPSIYVTEHCHGLLTHGVDNIHFYTLNKSKSICEIYAELGLRDTNAPAV